MRGTATYEPAVTGIPESRERGSARDTIDVCLSGGPEAPSRARRALQRLRGDLDPPLMETMRLLVGRQAVLVEVRDHGPGFEPRPRRRTDARDSGWGLFLVERLANRWGVGNDGPATRVWFEL